MAIISLKITLRPVRLTVSMARAASSYTKFLKDKTFINGQWVAAQSGATFNVHNPATGELIGSVPDMTAQDADTALSAAHEAFSKWKRTTAKHRCGLLRRWFELVKSNTEALGELLTLEQGKPLVEGRGEIAYGAGFIEWFAEEGRRTYGVTVPSAAPDRRSITIKQPVGVAAMITPWNFPHAMVTRKAAPALAAGCTVVLRPAEDTPYSALALCQLAEEAGFP